jgi:hypothetical protein
MNQVDNVGFDVLIKEFNVYKLRDFFPKRPSKITIRKQLFTGSVSIVVERAGVARIHPAETIKGAFFDSQNDQFFDDSNQPSRSSLYSAADIVTFQIHYHNQKPDIFESHQRSKICNAINEALELSRLNPQNHTLSKQFNLYSEDGEDEGGIKSDKRLEQVRRTNSAEGIRQSVSLPKNGKRGPSSSPLKSQMSWNGRQKSGSNRGDMRMKRAPSEENISDELQFFFGL